MDGRGAAFHGVKKLVPISLVFLAGAMSLWLAHAQNNQLGVGKDFTFPDYYPSTNGAVRLRSVITGKEYRFLSNNVHIALTHPRIEFYREDSVTLEWSAIGREATVDINTREVRGHTNMFFRTADDRLFLSGVGFLWQQSNSVLILSNKTFTWIDTQKLTNSSSKRSASKMKTLVAVSLVATAKLTAAEMEIPPARPGLTINAESSILMLKSNIVIYSNNVVVVDPPSKPGDDPMILKCVWLTGRRDTNGGIQEIEAHGKVSIDKGTIHARANYAIYTATNELMAMVGAYDLSNTNWPKPYVFTSAGPKSSFVVTNSGEAIIYDRIRDELRTVNAETIVPGATLKSAAPTNAPVSPANRPLKNP
ncbi:MAG TPA: LptA/OstA family protein [Verrucomicrobiae bacterium]|jgi:lipopolysaccharide export system protein LptA